MLTPIKPLSTILAELQSVISDLAAQFAARDEVIDKLLDSLAALTPLVVTPPVVVPPVTITSNITAEIVSQDGLTGYGVTPESPATVPVGQYSWSGENGSEIATGSGTINGSGQLRANGSMLDFIVTV